MPILTSYTCQYSPGHLFTIRLNAHITLCDDNWMDDLAQHHNDGEECPQKVPDDTSSLMSSNKQTGIMMTLWKCSLALAREWTDTMSWQHRWWWHWTQTKSTDIDDYGSIMQTLAGTAPRPKLFRQHSYFVCQRLLWVLKQQCISATLH